LFGDERLPPLRWPKGVTTPAIAGSAHHSIEHSRRRRPKLQQQRLARIVVAPPT